MNDNLARASKSIVRDFRSVLRSRDGNVRLFSERSFAQREGAIVQQREMYRRRQLFRDRQPTFGNALQRVQSMHISCALRMSRYIRS